MKNTNWIQQIPNNLFKKTSQGNQDGIIQYIIKNIEISNNFCVEFGCNTSDHKQLGSNTAYLINNNKWNSLLLDGDNENININLHRHKLTEQNICSIFELYNVPIDFGYLSIDVDSIDLWLLRSILTKYRPSFFSVEYNQNIPIDYAITSPPDSTWNGDKLYGASLKCFYLLANLNNYSLVYAGNSKNGDYDAFFIRNDLIIDCELPSYENFRNVYNNKLHPICKNNNYKLMIDFEHYLKTHNIIESQEFASQISYCYLCCDTFDPKMLTTYKSPYNKFRLGRNYDGGYILCDIPNLKYNILLSGGISNDISFEEDFCSKYDINCYAFDGTIENIKSKNKNITFIKKNIGNVDNETITTLKDYINKYDNIFIKMDIEGGEVEWIDSLSNEELSKFSQIVIEFHYPYSHKEISTFEKILHNHILVHFHANNCCGTRIHKNIAIPNVFECTFINKKYYSIPYILNDENIPSPIDMPNIKNKQDISLNYEPFFTKNASPH